MPVNSIGKSFTSAVKNAPKTVIKETNKIGNCVIKKLPFAKDKADSFVKETSKVGKNTAVGAVVIGGVVALAVGCIKTIHSKLKDVKED